METQDECRCFHCQGRNCWFEELSVGVVHVPRCTAQGQDAALGFVEMWIRAEDNAWVHHLRMCMSGCRSL